MVLSWFRSRANHRLRFDGKRPSAVPRKNRSFRPSLEWLECRLAPATYTVNVSTDTNPDGDGAGPGLVGDLRYAITKAAENGEPSNTIVFTSDTDQNPITLKKFIRLPTTNSLTINGNGPNNTTIRLAIDPTIHQTIFIAAQNSVAVLNELTLSGGGGTLGKGGAIGNEGTLTIQNSVLSNNKAEQGGAVYNAATGSLTIINTQFLQNRAIDMGAPNPEPFEGGAVYNLGQVNVQQGSSFTSNRATKDGGAIFNKAGGRVTVTDAKFNGNVATEGDGGAIYNESTQGPDAALKVFTSSLWTNHAAKGRGGAVFNAGVAKLANTTVDGNTANKGGAVAASNQDVLQKTTLERVTDADNKAVKAEAPKAPGGLSGPLGFDPGGVGGGLYVEPGAVVELISTIIAQNTADEAGPDIYGEVISLGYNLIGNGDGGSGYDATDLVGTPEEPFDPGLNPLGSYGGPTLSRTLKPWSPALDMGSYLPTDAPTDQRGYDRYVDGLPDIGAVEMQPADWTIVYAAVGDRVWEDLNNDGIQEFEFPGLAGVRVSLYDASGEVVGFAVTGSEGQFELLTALSGDYFLRFELPEGYVFSPQDEGGDDTLDSDVNADGFTDWFTLLVGEVNNDVDAGLVPV